MRYLWLLWFPLLFLPNLGFSQGTGFGTLEFSDFLMGPYVAMLVVATNWRVRLNVGRLTPWMGTFVVWALISTVTISVRYGYASDYYAQFGLLKIIKLVLYGMAGILTARALYREDARRAFDWSLLAAAMVTGISLWSTRVAPVQDRVAISGFQTQAEPVAGYSSTNAISVLAAILVTYLAGRWVLGAGSPRWRLVAPVGLIAIVAGMTVSDGRGGWVAAIAGGLYLVFRVRFNWRVLAMIAAAVIVILMLYQSQPEFRQQVDKTLFLPTEQYGYQGTRNVGTVDDGGRFRTWENEAEKIGNAPILGTGIYHRGGVSGLWTTGSHNYWLQIFLETGVIGGGLVLAILVVMWRQATQSRLEQGGKVDAALKAAILTAFVGGLGGEYFYGGIILFTLLAVYAPTGGVPLGATLAQGRLVRSPKRWAAEQVRAETGLASASGN